MSIVEKPPATDDPQALADLEEICRLLSEGKKVTDPELIRRITEGADRAGRKPCASSAFRTSAWTSSAKCVIPRYEICHRLFGGVQVGGA